MKRILITGAGGGGSNNLIRSIRSSGYPAIIIGTNVERYLLARSRADKNYLIPRGDSGPQYLEAINKIVMEEKIDLIIPNNDTEVKAISQYRDQIPTRTFLPSQKTIEMCQDKFTLSEHLSKNGFKVARTFSVPDPDHVEEVYKNFEGDDIVWCRMRKGSGSRGSLPVNNPEQVRFWIKYWHEMRGVPDSMFLLCEYLPGRDYAFQSLWKDGKLVIAKTCERVSYLFGNITPSGTSSTPRIGQVLNNPLVNELCTKAVQSIDPHATGMFSIDLKEDRHGQPCITEINIGRFFMISIVFSAVGRHNMAEIYLKEAFGEPVDVPESERYSDIGTEETFLIRGVDNETAVMTDSEIEATYTKLIS
jgi:carbamoyl-phosphate synthase large subunit